ncbi:MAG TPA: DUF5060 domain-containing protein, partial [Verrucomicrobiae bacterium]|nr:DUF5060 domain-containing protein [Verrucomicrobiae bacterium]
MKCLGIGIACLSLLTSAAVADGATTEQWGIFEVSLPGPTNGNPFIDVQLSARFSLGDTNIEASGFYDGGGVYRVRFMPDKQGHWQYATHSNARELNGRDGEFTVTPPSARNHGPVRVQHMYHFAYADGMPFRPIGTTSYNWHHM